MRLLISAFVLAVVALGQTPVAPTNEPVGSPRGENLGGYNVTNTFELGYRFNSVDGNPGMYRSTVNYGNGIRLLSSSFAMYSKDGKGKYFDQIQLNTSGLGNDPYQFSSLRIEKNQLYRYDMTWRQTQYFNPALTLSFGNHAQDTTYRLQDHNFTFFPSSHFTVIAGYSRNTQDGPALTTQNIGGQQFPLFSNVRRSDDEYRLGFEVKYQGVKLGVTRAWEYYKDDTVDGLSSDPTGIGSDGTLTQFQRSQPMHGTYGHWRSYFIVDRSRRWAVNGRLAYSGGRQNFIYSEALAAALSPTGVIRQQTFIQGNARKPVIAGNLTISFFPVKKLSIVNHTAIHHTRMDGDSVYSELGPSGFQQVNFQFLGIRLLSNSTDINYQLTQWLNLYSGYQVSQRRIRSIEDPAVPVYEQSNTQHTGTFGVRLRPLQPLTIDLNAEIARSNRPFYPVSDKDYHALSGRVFYRVKRLQLSAAMKTNYNFNTVSLSNYSSRSRQYFADGSWNFKPWMSIDASYSKLHLDTLTGLAYFVAGNLINDQSFYGSNIHTGTLGMRFSWRERVTFYAGYTRVQDAGSDVRVPTQYPAFYNVQVFPLSYEAPLARLSIRLHEKLRWNAGYEFYHYKEEFQTLQNYRAHTGYTSLTWSF